MRDTRVDTTLDAGLQRLVERQVNAFIARNRSRGIQNAAVLLVDSRDMGVRALVGSADYYNRPIQAGERYQRQALAGFDAEAVHLRAGHGAGRAASDDHPERRAFVVRRLCAGKLRPRFLGPVTATDALNFSRNIPAVYVASQLRQPTFISFCV